MSRDAFMASALAGAASGARSFTGVAAVALTEPGTDRVLSRPVVQRTAAVLAVGELAADKLPIAPSRLEAPGLSGRLIGAAVCGAALARRAESRPSVGRQASCAAVAAAVAATTAVAGTRFRGWASRRSGQDWIGAVAEDAVAIGLAAGAVRR